MEMPVVLQVFGHKPQGEKNPTFKEVNAVHRVWKHDV